MSLSDSLFQKRSRASPVLNFLTVFAVNLGRGGWGGWGGLVKKQKVTPKLDKKTFVLYN